MTIIKTQKGSYHRWELFYQIVSVIIFTNSSS